MPYPPEIYGLPVDYFAAGSRHPGRVRRVVRSEWLGGDFEGREAAWLANAMDISLEEQQEAGVLV